MTNSKNRKEFGRENNKIEECIKRITMIYLRKRPLSERSLTDGISNQSVNT